MKPMSDEEMRAWCMNLSDEEASRIAWILMIPGIVILSPVIALVIIGLMQ